MRQKVRAVGTAPSTWGENLRPQPPARAGRWCLPLRGGKHRVSPCARPTARLPSTHGENHVLVCFPESGKFRPGHARGKHGIVPRMEFRHSRPATRREKHAEAAPFPAWGKGRLASSATARACFREGRRRAGRRRESGPDHRPPCRAGARCGACRGRACPRRGCSPRPCARFSRG